MLKEIEKIELAGIKYIRSSNYHTGYFISNQVSELLDFILSDSNHDIITQYTLYPFPVTLRFHHCLADIHPPRLSQSQPGPQAVVR